MIGPVLGTAAQQAFASEALASRFPPSFAGSPWSYGFALFSLTLITAISLAILASYALEARYRREIDTALNNHVPPQRAALWRSPVRLHRIIVSGFLITIIMGALPDVILLLAWGEASDEWLDLMFLIDRLLDGSLIVPFLCSTFTILWAGQVVDHRLTFPDGLVKPRPPWRMIRERLKIVVVVLLLAIGVTLAKSVA
ncbi:MAG TPA: hypothetical protein VF655_09980 [Allosphingosinicella sp.]